MRQKIIRGLLTFLLPFLCLGPIGQAQGQSLCGPVLDGSILNFTWECWNDATFKIASSGSADSFGWQYTTDGSIDATSSEYEIEGIALRETSDEVWVVLNTAISLETGIINSQALNGTITYGDLFFNLSQLNFLDASNQAQLFGIRFDEHNDSGVTQLGVYGGVTAKSVVTSNFGPVNRGGYEANLLTKGKTPGYGDFAPNMTYYGQDLGLNVIASGQFHGPITLLTNADLVATGYDLNHFPGLHTVGFKFTKSLIIDTCGVIGGDGTSCADCAGIPCGQTVVDMCGVCGGDGSSCNVVLSGLPGCDGIIASGKVVDRCGVCGGDGSSCLGCEAVNIQSINIRLDSNALQQSQAVKRSASTLKKIDSSDSTFANNAIRQANTLYAESWGIAASNPSTVTSCTNTAFCAQVDITSTLDEYSQNAKELYNLGRSVITHLKRRGFRGAKLAQYERLTKSAYKHSKAAIESYPTTTSQCI